MPASTTQGVSWEDVFVAQAEITARYNRDIEMRIVPPLTTTLSGPMSAAIAVTAVPMPGRPLSAVTRYGRWGRGGSWRTAPQAALAALYELESALEESAKLRAQQHAF